MGCTCYIDVDYDPDCVADEAQIGMRIARREYKCFECGEKIEVGDSYERVNAHWPGTEPGKYDCTRTCAVCKEIRDCYFCSYCYGSIWEDLRNEILEEGDIEVCNLDKLSIQARHVMIDWLDVEFIEDDLEEALEEE
jgi:hypothetical protein